MTGIVYAKRVQCDWPDCQSEGEVVGRTNWTERVLPEGWLSLRPYICRYDGLVIGELCSIHVRASVADLISILRKPKEASDG